MKKHDWQSLNRSSHSPEDMTLNDIFEELRCAVTSDEDVQELAQLFDMGYYSHFGKRLALLLRNMPAPTPRATP